MTFHTQREPGGKGETRCANCGGRGPLTRRMHTPGSADFLDMPPGCGLRKKQLKAIPLPERRAAIERVINECNARREARFTETQT